MHSLFVLQNNWAPASGHCRPPPSQSTGHWGSKTTSTNKTKPNNVTLCFRKGHAVINLSSPGSEYEHSPTERPYFDLFPGCLEIFPQAGLPLKLFLALKSNLFPLNGKGQKKKGWGALSQRKFFLLSSGHFRSRERKEWACLDSRLFYSLSFTCQPVRQRRMPFLLFYQYVFYRLIRQPIEIKVTLWDICSLLGTIRWCV